MSLRVSYSDLCWRSVAFQHTGQLCIGWTGDVDMCGLCNYVPVHAWLTHTVTDDPDPPAGNHQNKRKPVKLFSFYKMILSPLMDT